MVRSMWSGLVLLVMVLAGAVGCATTAPFQERGDDQIVSERAKARWQHLVKGELGQAYALASPAYRSGNSEEFYRAGVKPGMWRGAEVMWVKCGEPGICGVEVEVECRFVARMSGPLSGKRVLTEVWRKDVGEWWYVPDER